MSRTPPAAIAAIRAGITDGFRARELNHLADELTDGLTRRAVRSVTAAGYTIRPNPQPLPDAPNIPPRRREVLIHVATGAGNAEIGRRLHLAEDTIKTQLQLLRATFGTRGRTQLAIRALALGVITLDEVAEATEAGAAA